METHRKDVKKPAVKQKTTDDEWCAAAFCGQPAVVDPCTLHD